MPCTCRMIKRWFSGLKTGGRESRHSSKDRYDISGLKLIRTIGTGSFGRVMVAQVREPDGNLSEELVAVKRMSKERLIKQKQVAHITTEKNILGAINHTFIVNMLSNCKDDIFVYIIMEFVPGGEFFTHLRAQKRLPVDSSRFYAGQVALVFEYLHSLDIIYRDLKPENLLIDRTGYLKVADFGFAKHVPLRTYTLCGTPEYLAPEVLTGKGHGKAVDWWTLGILIHEMIAGFPPFYSEDVVVIYKKILDGTFEFPKGFDSDAKSLVRHLLTVDLTRRYGNLQGGASDVLQHRFFRDKIDLEKLVNRSLEPPYVPNFKVKRLRNKDVIFDYFNCRIQWTTQNSCDIRKLALPRESRWLVKTIRSLIGRGSCGGGAVGLSA